MSSSGVSTLSFPALPTAAAVAESAAAFTHGHTAGYTAGLRKATAEAASRRVDMEAEHAALLRQCVARTDRAVAALEAAVRALGDVSLPLVTQAQDVLAHASLDLAEAVIGHELTQGNLSARAAIARVLEQPIRPGIHTIRMNPTDLSMLDEADIDSLGLQVIGDPSLPVGDATAEFEDGFLDARISNALDRVKEELLGAHE